MFLTTLTPQNTCIFDAKRRSVFLLITRKRAMQNHRQSDESCRSLFTDVSNTQRGDMFRRNDISWFLFAGMFTGRITRGNNSFFEADESSGKRLLMLCR